MKQNLPIAAILMIVALLPGCSGSALTDDDAISQIRTAGGYPRSSGIILNVNDGTPLGNEVTRLYREGYINLEPNRGFVPGRCTPSEKGKQIVKSCDWNGVWKSWNVELLTHTLDVTRIVDSRIDGQSQAATVIYEVAVIPTDYFTHLQSVDQSAIDDELTRQGKGGGRYQAQFSRWESGWRVGSIRY